MWHSCACTCCIVCPTLVSFCAHPHAPMWRPSHFHHFLSCQTCVLQWGRSFRFFPGCSWSKLWMFPRTSFWDVTGRLCHVTTPLVILGYACDMPGFLWTYREHTWEVDSRGEAFLSQCAYHPGGKQEGSAQWWTHTPGVSQDEAGEAKHLTSAVGPPELLLIMF